MRILVGRYDDGTATRRSYWVATRGDGSAPGQQIEIAVSYVEGGAATKLLGEVEHGSSIDASGPYGRSCLQDGDTHPRYLLLATGTGFTPYRAMLPKLRELLAKGSRSGAAVRHPHRADLLYGEEFEASAQANPGFTHHGCLSRKARATPRPHDRNGHLQNVLGPHADRDIAYL